MSVKVFEPTGKNYAKTAYLSNNLNAEYIRSKITDPNQFINIKNDTLLMVACRNGHFDLVKELLKIKSINLNLRNLLGECALSLSFKHLDICELLLTKSKLLNNTELTPEIYTNLNVFKLLVNHNMFKPINLDDIIDNHLCTDQLHHLIGSNISYHISFRSIPIILKIGNAKIANVLIAKIMRDYPDIDIYRSSIINDYWVYHKNTGDLKLLDLFIKVCKNIDINIVLSNSLHNNYTNLLECVTYDPTKVVYLHIKLKKSNLDYLLEKITDVSEMKELFDYACANQNSYAIKLILIYIGQDALQDNIIKNIKTVSECFANSMGTIQNQYNIMKILIKNVDNAHNKDTLKSAVTYAINIIGSRLCSGNKDHIKIYCILLRHGAIPRETYFNRIAEVVKPKYLKKMFATDQEHDQYLIEKILACMDNEKTGKLIKRLINKNTVIKNGTYPGMTLLTLHTKFLNGSTRRCKVVINHLLKYGADIHAMDAHGKTMFSYFTKKEIQKYGIFVDANIVNTYNCKTCSVKTMSLYNGFCINCYDGSKGINYKIT